MKPEQRKTNRKRDDSLAVSSVSYLSFCFLFLIMYALGFYQNVHASSHKAKPLLRIASASNFSAPLIDIRQQFEKTYLVKIDIIFGSSGKLYAQISHGAPYDIFLSADQLKPKALVDNKLAIEESLATYAEGLLVLCCPSRSIPKKQNAIGGYLLEQQKSGERIALANTRTAPYGMAAKNVLDTLPGLDRTAFVYGENVAQVSSLIKSGQVKLGFVNKWQAEKLIRDSDQLRYYWPIEFAQHRPIVQDLVILKQSSHRQIAQRFVQFLLSDAGRVIVERYGYK